MNDEILRKIAQHPALVDTMQRVRERGLHKVAAVMYELPEVNLPSVVQKLGAALYESHLRQQQIQKGIDAYKLLGRL